MRLYGEYERRRAAKEKWNRKAYKDFRLRIHRGSDLEDRLAAFIAGGGSANYLVATLLARHFGVGNPYKQIHTRRVETLYPLPHPHGAGV